MDLQLNLLTNIILNDYFIYARCILIFNDNFLLTYTGNLSLIQIQVNADSEFDKKLIFERHYGCQGIVVYTSRPATTFIEIEALMKNASDRFNDRKYMFLPQPEMSEDVLEIFNTTALKYVVDLIVITADEIIEKCNNETGLNGSRAFFKKDKDYIFSINTHQYVGVNGSNNVVLLDRWFSENTSFEIGQDLFPDKLKDQQGRVLKVYTFNYKPYSVPDSREGTEINLILEYSKRFNLTVELHVDDDGQWGELFDNGTGYGVMGKLLYDECDISEGGLCTWLMEYGFLDLSKSIIRTGITCIAPKPRLAEGWVIPFVSFSFKLWLSVGLAFVLNVIALFFMEVYKSKAFYLKSQRPARYRTIMEIFNDSVMLTTSVFLVQAFSVSKEMRDKSGKYLFSSMFILTIVISTSYCGGLSSSMIIPRYTGAINTVQDLVDSGIPWGATSDAWITSLQGATDLKDVTVIERFVKGTEEFLTQFNNKQFAFGIERLPAGYFAICNYISEEGVQDLRLMREDLYWEHTVLMARKSSIILPSIDKWILEIQETGLLRSWEFRIATKYMNNKILQAVSYSGHYKEGSDSKPVNLTLMHVEGAFGIWIIGVMLSMICFLVEIREKISKRKPTKTDHGPCPKSHL